MATNNATNNSGGGASNFVTDSGTATQSSGSINVVGSTNINTAGATDTVTVNLNDSIVLPNSSSDQSQGVISIGNLQIHNYSNLNQDNVLYIGVLAGNFDSVNNSGTQNVGVGAQALTAITSGSQNVCIGNQAALSLLDGINNSFVGYGAGAGLPSGNGNVCIGSFAGSNYNSTESDNICIYDAGTNGESNVVRIGSFATQTSCIIAGIAGVTVSNMAAVLIDTTTGQLGTVISSERYKENINNMAQESDIIYHLRPVTFNYKKDDKKQQQFGLIAEEVAEIVPQLVTYDKEGNPDSVHYHDLPVLLLNEIKKLKEQIEAIKKEL